MTYYVVQNAVTAQTVSKGNYDGAMTIQSEWVNNNLKGAREAWHAQCRALSNDDDTYKYKCCVMDSQLNVVDDLVEFLDKGTTPQPEPTE